MAGPANVSVMVLISEYWLLHSVFIINTPPSQSL
nr:MAG TPA: hypothetical protein [Caudoviricetes sp.]